MCVSGGGGGATPAGTGGQVQYANGGATALAAVSTTTLTFTSFPANQVGTLGTLIGGANTSLTWWGLSTSTNLSAGQVPFASSASALATNNNFFWDNNMQTLGVGTSTPRASLTVASSTGVQLLLTDGLSTNLAPWYHRVINGNFYIGTSSPTTFATSTNPIFSIIPNSTSNATTTFSFTDWVLKQTSPVAFSILDAFSTPTVLVNTASTTGSAFTVVATTSTASQIYGNTAIKLFDIDSFGNFSASSTAPTLSSGQIDGTNNGGRVTNCSSACTVTFANGGWPKSPECSADPESGSVVNTFSYVITKTTLVVTETGLGSFDYHCGIGN